MRYAATAAKWAGRVLGALILLLLLLCAGIVGGSATPPGQALLQRLAPSLSNGMVHVAGLSGWLFGAERIARVDVSDANGAWLSIDNLTVVWSPLRLFGGTVAIQRVAAERVVVLRRPQFPESGSTGSNTVSLPVRIDLAALHIAQVDVAAPVIGSDAGPAVSLSVDGSAQLLAIDQGQVNLDIRRLADTSQKAADKPPDAATTVPADAGTYTVNASLTSGGLHAALRVAEPVGGLIGSLAALPTIGPITSEAGLDGPLSAIATNVVLTAGPLQAHVTGQVDANSQSADLQVAADAPAMTPRPDLSWHSVTLHGHLHGPFAKPDANATLKAEGLSFGQASIGRATAEIEGNAGRVSLTSVIGDIRVPGPQPDLLQAAPLQLAAAIQLDSPDKPLTFSLRHKLFTIDGSAATGGEQHAEAHITVPEISPLARAGGVENVAGRLALTLGVAKQGADVRLMANGTVGVTTAPGPAVALFGNDTKLDLLATLHDQTVRVSKLDISSGAFSAGMAGTVAPNVMDIDWHVALADLTTLQTPVNGPFHADGKVKGSLHDLAVSASLTGELGAPGVPRGNVDAEVALAGLPDAPTGHVTAHGTLLGAPLDLAVSAGRETAPGGTGSQAGSVRLAIERADWKSAHAEGTVLVDLKTGLPQGRLAFAMTRLPDLQPLLGQAVNGAVSGKLDATTDNASLNVTATGTGLPGLASVARTTLDVQVRDPLAHPNLNATLVLEDVAARGVNGSARIEAKGPLNAVALRLAATLPALAGASARIDAAGTIDATAKTATIASFQTDWKQTPIRLLAPVRVNFANGASVAGLRIGVRQAVLEANGRIDPRLDLTVRLRDVPASLAALADPELALDGTFDAEATLTGNPALPEGTARVTAHGLRLATGQGRGVPAGELTATATLRGANAQLDLHAQAGTARIALTGTVPVTAAGRLDLRATGAADLAMTDPLLTPSGLRARGRITLDVAATGTLAAPRVNGSGQLTGGSFRDLAHGVDFESVDVGLTADGGAIRLSRFSAKAGPGTINASGDLDLTAPDRPISITITAHDARPLASDALTASMDTNMTIRGSLSGQLTVGGRVLIRRADVRVPDRMPASIPTLTVRIAGTPPPPPPSPGPDIALDLTVDAPEQIFVRGRGVDAELGGSIRLQGSVAKPVPSGGFTLRHGQFSLAAQTLTFSTGKVSFNGGSLTDPSLDFTATSTVNNVTATLTIGSTASKPKITLSSAPTLPQDEILAYLLFGQREASLGPLQIAQVAATVAMLAGAAPAVSNPLENLRGAIGLDRLTVGAGSQVEAGRYVARNVYVGAKQSVTGTGAQAVVQVDLTKGLKLEATAGTANTPSATGTGGSTDSTGIGLVYKFQY